MKILGIFIWRKNRYLIYKGSKCSFHFQRRHITCFYCLCEQSKVLNAFFQKFFLVLLIVYRLPATDNRLHPYFCLLPLVYNYELCIMNYEFSFILSLYIVEFIMQFDGIVFNLNLFQEESTD